MSGWDDLVTTALLGTDRRALPDTLPAAVARLAAKRTDTGASVLDAAAGYVSYLTAGARPPECPAPDPAPRQRIDPAPEPAQALLRRLLKAGDVALVDEWLTECGARGLGVRSGSWTVLATAAAASGGPDRSLVRTVLGQRGLAFLRLNPAWRPVLRPAGRVRTSADAAPDRTGPGWSAASTRAALGAIRVTRSLGRRHVIVAPLGAGADLQQAVADADLDAWHGHTGLPPAPLLDLVRSSSADHLTVVAAGLVEAAVRQRHPEWATALARSGHVTPDLVAVVPPAELGSLARSWAGGGHDPARVAQWLGLLPAPWGAPVTDAGLWLLASARLEPRVARRLGLVLGHHAELSAHQQVQRLSGHQSPGSTARPQASPPAGLTEAAEVLALRVEIRHAFGAGHPTEETP